MVDDLFLVYSNCELYNDPESEFGEIAQDQREAMRTFLQDEMDFEC